MNTLEKILEIKEEKRMNLQEKLKHHLKRINQRNIDQSTNMRRLREIKRLKALIKQSN